MGLIDSILIKRCGAEKETAHFLCECEALAALTRTNLCFSFLDPEDVRSLGLGAIWNFIKEQGSSYFDISLRGIKGLSKRPA